MRYRFVATVSTCVYIHACIYIYISIHKEDDSLAFCTGGGQFRGYVAFGMDACRACR